MYQVSAEARAKDPCPLPCSRQVAPRSYQATTSDQTDFKHVTFQPSRPSKTFETPVAPLANFPLEPLPSKPAVGKTIHTQRRPAWLFVPVVRSTCTQNSRAPDFLPAAPHWHPRESLPPDLGLTSIQSLAIFGLYLNTGSLITDKRPNLTSHNPPTTTILRPRWSRPKLSTRWR